MEGKTMTPEEYAQEKKYRTESKYETYGLTFPEEMPLAARNFVLTARAEFEKHPFEKLPKKAQDVIFYGTKGKKIKLERRSEYGSGTYMTDFEGIVNNLERRYLANVTASSNMMRETLQRWPYGEVNRATRKTTGENGSCTSTFHLEDGSYLRLQNLSLSYTFPNKWLKKAKIKNMKVYLQGSNLFTFTNYSGFNPEVNKRADDALRPGEDYCSYPLSRTFSIGLNFNMH